MAGTLSLWRRKAYKMLSLFLSREAVEGEVQVVRPVKFKGVQKPL